MLTGKKQNKENDNKKRRQYDTSDKRKQNVDTPFNEFTVKHKKSVLHVRVQPFTLLYMMKLRKILHKSRDYIIFIDRIFRKDIT